MKQKYSVGDTVVHLLAKEKGTVTNVRDEAEGVYVEWSETTEQNGWFDQGTLRLETTVD